MDTKNLLLQLTSIRALLIEQIKITLPESKWELHFNRVARTQIELTMEFLLQNRDSIPDFGSTIVGLEIQLSEFDDKIKMLEGLN